jgi:alpha-D-ribose 1-methylphosphonate 5-triphosphate diphosphatase PhnM
MMQPRLGTPSAVSTSCELTLATQRALFSELKKEDALYTVSPLDLAPGPRQRGIPREPFG